MNGRGGGVGSINGGCRFPFTASQWQELEHQALIFKYMVSGVPIPPDLLFTVRRSLDSKKLFAHPTPSHIGWNCFQMGLGRKIDPEPGRCRRTDGKKWRCSKEAFQESKYCEKHMHRGKNRSRKPVEQATSCSTPHLFTSMVKPTHSIATTLSSNNAITHSSLSSVTSDSHLFPPAYYSNIHPYHHPKVDSTHLGLDSGSYHRSRYSNSNHGGALKEDIVDEHAFFNEADCRAMKGSSMEDSWQLTPLTMSSGSGRNSKQSGHGQYPYLQLQGLEDSGSELGQSHQMRQYNESSRDSRCEQIRYPTRDDNDDDDQARTQKTVYRFLEECPPENKDSWLNLDDKSSNCSSSSTTQLSISIPVTTSHHVFPIFSSRPQNGDSKSHF